MIEKHEHYNKQSYRNRCTIYSANGLLDLVVPVMRYEKPKMPITQVRIAYDTLWQKLHFKAIESAYSRSPFYEYYNDDLAVFFNNRFIYLYDFNMQIMQVLCGLMKIPFSVRESTEYIKSGPDVIDLRNSIHPKVDLQEGDPGFVVHPYTQVFADRFGFRPGLSILDLLFNAGPEAKDILSN